ncbi:hypothetical protein DFJ73DRAFT_777350 [Zopfochytrium polystomum]|nr:hypothetical protein DFJ73DRAFT_777350 [Zopfochytrium polystomum]
MGYVTVLVQHNWAMQPAPSPPPPPSPQPPSDSKHLGNHHHHHHEHRNHNHPPPTRASRHTPRLQIRDRGRHHVHFRDQLKPDDKRVGAVRAFVPDSVRQFVEAVDDAVDRGVCGGPTPTRPGGVGRSDGKAGAFAGDEPWLWGGEKEYERRRERAANRAIWEVWIGRRPGVNGEDDHDDESEVEGRSGWRNACRAMRRAAKLIARLAPLALSSEVADPFRWDYVREACRTGNWIVPADLNGLNSPVGGVHPRAAPSAGSPASPITSGPKKTDGKKFRRRYEEPLGDREDGGAEATLAAKRARRRCAALARRSVLVLSRVSVPTSVPLQCWTGQSPVLVHGAAAGEFLPEERALDVEAAGRESVRFVAWIRARCYEVLREALDTNELATDDEEVASLLLIISELEDAISASLEDLQGLEASEAENGSGKRTFIETGIECLVTLLFEPSLSEMGSADGPPQSSVIATVASAVEWDQQVPIEDDRREEEEDDVIKDMREDEEAKKDGVSIPKTLPLSTGPYHNNYERVNDGSTVDSSARPTGSNTPEFARDANAAASDPLGPSSLTVRYADPVAEAASAAVIAGWRQVAGGFLATANPTFDRHLRARSDKASPVNEWLNRANEMPTRRRL